MTVSETSKFTEDILTSANQQAQKILQEAESEQRRLLEEARNSIGRETADIIRNAESESEAIRRREVSEVRHRAKLREQAEKDKILTEVLEETKKSVLQALKDEKNYFAYLVRIISEALPQLDLPKAVIHLNAEDLKKLDGAKLVQEVSKVGRSQVMISKDPIPCLAGAVVSSSDDKIRLDCTIEQKFEALEPSLLTEAGRLLFGGNTNTQ